MNYRSLLPQKRNEYQLTQAQVGQLLGVSDTTITRVEAGVLKPTIHLAIGCQVLFGIEPDAMYPDIAAEVREAVVQRVVSFATDLERERLTSEAHQRFLADIVEREDVQLNPTIA